MIPAKIIAPYTYLRTEFIKQERRESFASHIRREIRGIHRDFPNMPRFKHRPRLRFLYDTGYMNDVRFSHSGKNIIVEMDWQYAKYFYESLWGHLSAQYFWYASCGPEAGPVTINISDGDAPSAAQFAQSAFLPDVGLLPDAHFFEHRGYAKAGEVFANSKLKWSERSDAIVWRGAASGQGYMCFEDQISNHQALQQRIRLAQLAKGSEIDFGFVEHELTKNHHNSMKKAGILRGKIPEYSWVNHKYAIDVDGYSNAWSNFFIRLKLGCCVLKVDSDFGYRQWYYDKLTAYEHYVPIKADLSDLFTQIEWVKANQDKAEAIANAGRILADSFSFETETEYAVQCLKEQS